MGRGSIFFSKAKGKIGNVVLANVNGQEVQRAYNGEPANPRTASQMYQRGLFADVVKFFTRGQQNFFKFAFEGKKKTESDYNAFVRANMKYGCYLTKGTIDDPTKPKVGAFIMTQGSIPTASFDYSDDENRIGVRLSVDGSDVENLGQVRGLSAVLKEWNPAIQEGDIITLCTITSGYVFAEDNLEGSYMAPAVAGVIEPRWSIRQFIVDSTDTSVLSDIGIACIGESGAVHIEDIDEFDNFDHKLIAGSVLCVSRNTKSGLKVATSQLALSYGARMVWYRTNPTSGYVSQQYRDIYLNSWGTSEEVILQGALARKVLASVVPSVTSLPLSVAGSFSDALREYALFPCPGSFDNVVTDSDSFVKVKGSNLAVVSLDAFSFSVTSIRATDIYVIDDSTVILRFSVDSVALDSASLMFNSQEIAAFAVSE